MQLYQNYTQLMDSNVSKLAHIHICTHHSLSLSSHELLLLFSSEGEAWIHLLKEHSSQEPHDHLTVKGKQL